MYYAGVTRTQTPQIKKKIFKLVSCNDHRQLPERSKEQDINQTIIIYRCCVDQTVKNLLTRKLRPLEIEKKKLNPSQFLSPEMFYGHGHAMLIGNSHARRSEMFSFSSLALSRLLNRKN